MQINNIRLNPSDFCISLIISLTSGLYDNNLNKLFIFVTKNCDICFYSVYSLAKNRSYRIIKA